MREFTKVRRGGGGLVPAVAAVVWAVEEELGTVYPGSPRGGGVEEICPADDGTLAIDWGRDILPVGDACRSVQYAVGVIGDGPAGVSIEHMDGCNWSCMFPCNRSVLGLHPPSAGLMGMGQQKDEGTHQQHSAQDCCNCAQARPSACAVKVPGRPRGTAPA